MPPMTGGRRRASAKEISERSEQKLMSSTEVWFRRIIEDDEREFAFPARIMKSK